jgi:Lon protease-like protein
MRLPLHVYEERYKLMIGTCMVTDQTFGVVLIESGEEVGGPAEVRSIGTTARIVEIDRLPEGRMNLVTIGVDRFRIHEQIAGKPYAVGRVEILPDGDDEVSVGMADRVGQLFRRYLSSQGISTEQVARLQLPDDPLALSYLIAANFKVALRQKQQLLEAGSAAARLRREQQLLEWEAGGPGGANARSFSLN